MLAARLKIPVIYPADEVLNVAAAARLIGVTRYTMLTYVLRGLLPGREIAGRVVIRREDLERFRHQRRKSKRQRATT